MSTFCKRVNFFFSCNLKSILDFTRRALNVHCAHLQVMRDLFLAVFILLCYKGLDPYCPVMNFQFSLVLGSRYCGYSKNLRIFWGVVLNVDSLRICF